MSDIDTLTDEALVERIRDGDQSAFRVLEERYARRLRKWIERRLSPGIRRRVAASDILQEAHLIALQRYSEFEDRGEGSFGRWFTRIVDLKIREAVERHMEAGKRSVGNEVTRARRAHTANLAGHGPSPSQVTVAAELRAAVGDAMSQLPESHRTVLQLLREQQLTLAEAADRMGRTPGAVKKLYGRALARMESLLGMSVDDRHERRRPTR